MLSNVADYSFQKGPWQYSGLRCSSRILWFPIKSQSMYPPSEPGQDFLSAFLDRVCCRKCHMTSEVRS